MSRITVVHAPTTLLRPEHVAELLRREHRTIHWHNRRGPHIRHDERVNRDLTHAREPVDLHPPVGITDAWDGSLAPR